MIRNVVGIVAAFFVVVGGLTVVGGSWYTIDSGERGVILRNGAVTGTAEPGLGFKFPIIDSVKKISTQTHTATYENMAAYSRDQQTAIIKLSINYRLPSDQVETIYVSYGGQDGIITRLLDPKVNEQVKNVFGQYNAVTAIQDRPRLNADIQNAIKDAVIGPIAIESVQIENIDFSDAYENSIEQRMLAEVEVQKTKQVADKEKVQAEIVVIQANAQADAKVAQAEAEAKAIRVRGEAEADAISFKGKALRENPELIQLTQAEKWNGILPTTMVPGSTVPFIDVTSGAVNK